MTSRIPEHAPDPGRAMQTVDRWHRIVMSPLRRSTWRTLRRYLGFIVATNLAWEIVQLPLYTLWDEASAGFIVYAVAHCTGGDVLIALSALILALVLCRSRRWPGHHYIRVAFVTTLIGASYTVFSEWHNTEVTNSWAYSEWMPVLPVIGTGLAPLAQWFLLPPLAFWWAGQRRQSTHCEEIR